MKSKSTSKFLILLVLKRSVGAFTLGRWTFALFQAISKTILISRLARSEYFVYSSSIFFFILFSIILCIFQNLWILKYILYLLSFNEFAKWSLVKLLITIYTHAYLSRRSRDKFVSRYNFVSKHEIHTNMLKIKIIRLIIYIFPSFSTLISWCIVHT